MERGKDYEVGYSYDIPYAAKDGMFESQEPAHSGEDPRVEMVLLTKDALRELLQEAYGYGLSHGHPLSKAYKDESPDAILRDLEGGE